MEKIAIVGSGDAALLSMGVFLSLGITGFDWYANGPFSFVRFWQSKKAGLRYLHIPKRSKLYESSCNLIGLVSGKIKGFCYTRDLGLIDLELLGHQQDLREDLVLKYCEKTKREKEPNLMNGLACGEVRIAAYLEENSRSASVAYELFWKRWLHWFMNWMDPHEWFPIQELDPLKYDLILVCEDLGSLEEKFKDWVGTAPPVRKEGYIPGRVVIGEILSGFEREGFAYIPDLDVKPHRISWNGTSVCLEFPEVEEVSYQDIVGSLRDVLGVGGIADVRSFILQRYHFSTDMMSDVASWRDDVERRTKFRFIGRFARVDRSKIEDIFLEIERVFHKDIIKSAYGSLD